MKQLLNEIGISFSFLIIGFLGGIISVIAKNQENIKKGKPLQSTISMLSTILVGGLTANYVTPLIIHFIKIENGEFGIAFIVGYLGLIAMEKIINKLKI